MRLAYVYIRGVRERTLMGRGRGKGRKGRRSGGMQPKKKERGGPRVNDIVMKKID